MNFEIQLLMCFAHSLIENIGTTLFEMSVLQSLFLPAFPHFFPPLPDLLSFCVTFLASVLKQCFNKFKYNQTGSWFIFMAEVKQRNLLVHHVGCKKQGLWTHWIWEVWSVWEEPVGRPPLHALLQPTHRYRNLSMEPLDFRDDGGGKCRRLNSDAHMEGTCRLPKAARRIADRLSFISPSCCFASETLKDFQS